MHAALNLDTLTKADTTRRRLAVYEGLPVKMLRALLKRGDISIGDLSRVIAQRRTLERRLKDGDRLNREESDRLARFLPILELCEHIFGGTDPAMRWLRKPKRAFGGVAPLDLLATSSGSEEVNELLQQSMHGMLA
jgi:putative toxin-antitoxin system antitoxin component (TIGR02293 family)